MNTPLYEPTIALAGVMQAATLVQQMARNGHCDKTGFETSINSIFATEPKTLADVYGNLKNLKLGYEKLIETLESKTRKKQEQFELTRYFFNLIHLERKLASNKKMMGKLSKDIQDTVRQANYFSPTHSNVVAKLADVYLHTISTFKFRLQIVGKVENLQQATILNNIRALLLAGIRSALLWQQVGGSRWQLLFQRKKIVATLKACLAES